MFLCLYSISEEKQPFSLQMYMYIKLKEALEYSCIIFVVLSFLWLNTTTKINLPRKFLGIRYDVCGLWFIGQSKSFLTFLFTDILTFDNSYSWTRAKELFYSVQKFVPDMEICSPQFSQAASCTEGCNGTSTLSEELDTVVALQPRGYSWENICTVLVTAICCGTVCLCS